MYCYTFAMASRLKRRIFSAMGVREAFVKNITVIFFTMGIGIEMTDYLFYDYGVVLSFRSEVPIAQNRLSNAIRTGTSARLRDEFSELWAMPSLWTRKTFFTEGGMNADRIEAAEQFFASLKSR